MVEKSEADGHTVRGGVESTPSARGEVEEEGRLRHKIAGLELALGQRDRLLSMVAHDLRNPLLAIEGHIGLLFADHPHLTDQERQFSLDTVQRQIRVAGELVDDLLDVQAIDAGAIRLSLEWVGVRAAVELVVADCGLSEVVELDIDDELVAKVDRRRFAQILSNLLSNADTSGEPPIVVSSTRKFGWLVLRVRDHGPGVAEEFVPCLFDRFSQVAGSRHPSKRGTGLGLSIARELTRAHGGDVVYETHRSGACFAVTLPT